MAHATGTYYYYVPREVDPSAYAWVQPTIIEDEDLTFGGKALSTWYEEDRRRHSSGSDEEERRGRERVRRNYRSGKSHKKHLNQHDITAATPCLMHPPSIRLFALHLAITSTLITRHIHTERL
ncbi:hypothetical protein FSARC_5976 [Fusarium sarcochroum]|uniref:Uncharacterized protein n=1 Tax=Fusarium sarcochroum TaxID=1208366 RepID=A0A8H4X8Z1_9HYPO|nr:hypothetical protein FSARC_5976 [Fusarium sarcochroum]